LTHGTPVVSRVLITGLPRAIASSCTSPNASARVTAGSTKTSQAAYHAATASSSRLPRKKTRVWMPSDAASASRLARRGPSPTTTAAKGESFNARSNTLTPLYGTSLPTNSAIGPTHWRRTAATDGWRSGGTSGAMSRPNGTTAHRRRCGTSGSACSSSSGDETTIREARRNGSARNGA
jgi:hypothetical protein